MEKYFEKRKDVDDNVKFNTWCTFDPPCKTKTGLTRSFKNKTTFVCHMVEEHGFDCMISEPSSTPQSSRAASPVSSRQERQNRYERRTEMKRSHSDSSESDAPISRQSSSSSSSSEANRQDSSDDMDVPVGKMALVRRLPQPY